MSARLAFTATAAWIALAVLVSGARPGRYTPPRYRSGSAPPNQIAAVGGGEGFLEVDLSASGAVTGIVPLRTTPPFTESVISTVRGWTFSPAVQEMIPDPDEVPQTPANILVKSKVFVAAVFRPPVLNGPSMGVPPKDVGSAPVDMARMFAGVCGTYPPNARFDGTVLVEIHVSTTGAPLDSRVVQSAPGLDGAALAAIAAWSFRPARVNGTLVDSYAYVAFGLRAPVGIGTPTTPVPPTGATPPTGPTPPTGRGGLGSLIPSF